MRYTFLLFLILFCFFFCKKKSPPTNNQQSNNTPELDWGFFSSYYTTTELINGANHTDSSQLAVFFESPTTSNSSYVSAGSVSVNGFTLYSDPPGGSYYNTNNVIMSPLNWSATGSGTIPAFNFSYSPKYPGFIENNQLPDTVIKSSGITFTLSNITFINYPLKISISQGSSLITRTLSTIPSTISVSASEISSFLENYPFTIQVSMFNISKVQLNNKQYSINSNRVYKKYCYLK